MERKLSVLVIEDEADFAEILATELEHFPLECQVSDNFTEGLSRLTNQKYAAVVLDLRIKKGTGEDLILRVRKDKKHLNYDTPIIVISGNLDLDLAKQVAPFADAMLVKPFKIPEFCKAVLEKIKHGSKFKRD